MGEVGVSTLSERMRERRMKDSSLALAHRGHWPTVLVAYGVDSFFVMGSREKRKRHGD